MDFPLVEDGAVKKTTPPLCLCEARWLPRKSLTFPRRITNYFRLGFSPACILQQAVPLQLHSAGDLDPLAPFLHRYLMMKETWCDIALYDTLQAGQGLEAFLRENRIDARTYRDKVLEVVLFLRPPQAVFHVQVRKSIYKMAQNVLKSRAPAILQDAIHCPACGSLRVIYPHLSRGSPPQTLVLNLGIVFRVTPHQAYCGDCHHVWGLPKGGHAALQHETVPHAP